MSPAIELTAINKSFGAVHANQDVNLTVERGTIHGIVGENGAGKSTLMSILYGFYEADSGEIRVGGKPIAIRSPANAIEAGIGMVHQHFMLVEPLDRRRKRHARRGGRRPVARRRGQGRAPSWRALRAITASRSTSMRSSAICRSACSSASRS